MAKLASVRVTRLYGPEQWKYQFELANAVAYLIATLLGLVGVVLFLPAWNTAVGFWCLLVALLLIVLVNVHDLYAQLAGFDFRLPLATLDPQLALVEIAAPLVEAIGGLLFLIAFILFLRITKGEFDSIEVAKVTDHAYSLLIAGSVFWLLGSIHNSFQVYVNTDTRVQFMQKTMSVPMLIACTLFLVAAILSFETWSLPPIAIIATKTAIWIAIVGAGLLLFAAIMNVIRVLQMREVDHTGGLLEPLRGGAQEELERKRDEEEVLLDRQKYAADVEEGISYKDSVIHAEDLNR
ncbi:hypothetical protein KC19_6G210100 [Ceratodon purpureus]|uniref:Uncharacterized protein n=1 Tax=Ceratodon purpureus TaxID=3225 RepID=A0A8T0HJW4_CERPU|nr:hypothetical protein KC19_6G210100 [Ceratodon purpureus]